MTGQRWERARGGISRALDPIHGKQVTTIYLAVDQYAVSYQIETDRLERSPGLLLDILNEIVRNLEAKRGA